MIVLFCSSPAHAQDFELSGSPSANGQHDELILTARQMLRVRGHSIAVKYLDEVPFSVIEATNHFNDEFCVMYAMVLPTEYEKLGQIARDPLAKQAFDQIAKVVTELGPFIRFIAVDLQPVKQESWDVFICHANDDKKEVAEPLYHHFESVGILCWYDRGEILWGDSIVAKINEGLRLSRFVIVVVSPVLLNKKWATKEMNAALGQEIEAGKTRGFAPAFRD